MNEPTTIDSIRMIAEERQRQKAKWSAEHDDSHDDGSLAVVAAVLAIEGTDAYIVDQSGTREDDPWGLISKNRDDRLRRLVVAGALIAAEIERELRAEVICRDFQPNGEHNAVLEQGSDPCRQSHQQ